MVLPLCLRIRSADSFRKSSHLLRVFFPVCLECRTHIDPARHLVLTGTSNAPVLALARYLSEQGKSMWIRHVLVPGWTTDADDLYRLADFIGTLRTVERVEVLPYHAMARHKYEALHLPYPLGDTPVPTAEEIACAEAILCRGKTCRAEDK